MKAFIAFLTLYFCTLSASGLEAQQLPENRIQHSQNMHQYIVSEAFKFLKQKDPHAAVRLERYLDTEASPFSTGTRPWETGTILAGAWREDAEDVVYGYGSQNRAQWPAISISKKTTIMDFLYSNIEDGLKNDPDFQEALASVTHFWDELSDSKELFKEGIIFKGTWPLSAVDTDNQNIRITPNYHAWDKAQQIVRPNWDIAIRDKWWLEGDTLYYSDRSGFILLPQKTQHTDEVAVKYESLMELYNSGKCKMDIPGLSNNLAFTLTQKQRHRYVWEMLGRLCHLLGDMSIPAHTHRDIHIGNLNQHFSAPVGSLNITVRDRDSYESWITGSAQAYWNAGNIGGDLIDLLGQNDPLYFLFKSMREKAAAFASDDADGEGKSKIMPRRISEIPDRYCLSGSYSEEKLTLMRNIRDNTFPFAIRATATLLAWFANQLNMKVSFEVRNVGAPGYTDFFHRESFDVPFPDVGTPSGTIFTLDVGAPLSLRSHFAMHPVTAVKFTDWSDRSRFTTMLHQLDTRVEEGQSDVECRYLTAIKNVAPSLLITDEIGRTVTTNYPSFRDPWHVDPSKSDKWQLHQPAAFEMYQPFESTTSNGGLHINNYIPSNSKLEHYSIRASKIWDARTLKHKWPTPEVGDYIFQDWHTAGADLFAEPLNEFRPPHPNFLNYEQYDTRAINFRTATAIVSAQTKAHRSVVGPTAPSKINSQRKVVLTQDGSYHTVYESNGKIWYLYSTDKGVSWSPEMLVSENSEFAERPAIAAVNGDLFITYVVNSQIQVRHYYFDGWRPIYAAFVTMPSEATPAIAVVNSEMRAPHEKTVAAVVWEDAKTLKYALLSRFKVYVDNEVLMVGTHNGITTDQPRYPSIAASVPTVRSPFGDQMFHIVWLENGSIFYTFFSAEMKMNPAAYQPANPSGNTYFKETVHSRNGSIGLSYPAVHAPSMAIDDLGHVHVVFDVRSWPTAWPVHSLAAGASSAPVPINAFALRQLVNLTAATTCWQTTTTIVSSVRLGSLLTSPTVGARPATALTPKHKKESSISITYNDRNDALYTVMIDTHFRQTFHNDGYYPNMTVWSATPEGLLDVFSRAGTNGYDWELHSSQNNLSKADSRVQVRMREIVLSKDSNFSVFGLADLRLSSSDGANEMIDWNPVHDSLLLDNNTIIPGKMRSETFVVQPDKMLRYRAERYAQGLKDQEISYIVRVVDAVTGDVLTLQDFPADEQDETARLEAKALDLSAFIGRQVLLEADIVGIGKSHHVGITDRYAMVDPVEYQASLEEESIVEDITPITAGNSPNPFNPSTTIHFKLNTMENVRLVVHDLLGREITVLVDDILNAGEHQVRFDGSALPSGVYLYQLTVGERTVTRNMHLVK